MEKTIHEETSDFGLWFKMLMYPLIAFYAVVFAGALTFGKYDTAIPIGAALVVFLIIVRVFGKLWFSINGSEVSFGYGIFRKRLLLSEIVECEPYDVRFSNYYGYGIRYGKDGTAAYITHSGPGVRITAEGQKRPYVVTVEQPEEICKIMKELGAAR